MEKFLFLKHSQLILAIIIIFSFKKRPAVDCEQKQKEKHGLALDSLRQSVHQLLSLLHPIKLTVRFNFHPSRMYPARHSRGTSVVSLQSYQVSHAHVIRRSGTSESLAAIRDFGPMADNYYLPMRANADSACLKFSLKHCSISSNQLKPRKLKILNKKNTRQKGTRIVNGTNAMPYEFPYQVQITENGNHICGGAILNEDYILTAAHCFFDDDGSLSTGTFEVIAGQHNTDEEGGVEQFRNVKTKIIHEHHDLDTSKNDIALILLNYALALTRRVQPAILPPPNYDATGQLAIVTGWGHNQTNGSFPDILQKVELPIISNEDCNKAYNRPDDHFVQDTAFCTLYPGGGKDACQGDSGGPVSLRLKNGSYLVIGVVSLGDECGSPEFPGVYTKVSKYIDWIQLNVV